MYILITGCGGFIGFHLTLRLLKNNKKIRIIGIDNLNSFYSKKLKDERVKILKKNSRFKFIKFDLINKKKLSDTFIKYKFKYVVHLAAQAGVRYSLKNPISYVNSNLLGFINILEACRHNKSKHLIYASSSSVYGGNEKIPYSETDQVNHPISLYAATKKSNELMAHSYSNLYKLPTTGLRFFTVYGPWGRPDMALFKFTKNMLENKSIDIFNYGNHSRDFTYIDDITKNITKLISKIPKKNNKKKLYPNTSNCPFRIVNIGNSKQQKLMQFIKYLEEILKIKSKKNYLSLQKGDVKNTLSDTSLLQKLNGKTKPYSTKKGIHQFVEWYKSYYNK